jgi:acetoacetyl-CoA synthetase
MSKKIWEPTAEQVERANMTAFLRQAAKEEPGIVDYDALYRWSIEQPHRFWAQVWQFCGVLASQPYVEVVDDVQKMPGARWFEGARLNFAENLLRHRDQHLALIFWNEEGRQTEWTYAELFREVAALAGALRAAGVRAGDRVAGYLPNLPHAVAAMLAAASVGAIWSSCSPDFGTKGIVDRFGQIGPRILFCADGYRYAGKRIDLRPRIAELMDELPEVERFVMVPYLGLEGDLAALGPRAVAYQQFVSGQAGELVFEQLAFDHPLYILYSSGTTGLPKCLVHGAGGTLVQHLKELVLHTDLRREDRIFYHTTCGWMMWNWLVSSLAAGATVVLYDGAPLKPRPEILVDLCEQERVTVFGTSAKYVALLEKEGVRPVKTHGLGDLRRILSTGSPLLPEGFDYLERDFKPGVQISSISGGTDIVSCFALGNPIGAVYRGELQTRGLGMAVEVFDEEGRPVVDWPGELVCTKAFPSMPVSFWNDPDGAKYRAAYFEHYPGVWRHGDWARLTPHGGLVIHGRSDATLNPAGVRIGTAEIYRQVEKVPEVLESLVIGQEHEGDVRIVLFVKLREGAALTEELAEKLRRNVREGATAHHVPKKIVAVADIPRTLSGKITELAVREVVHGRPVKNVDALANPEALELFRDLAELRSEE